MEKCSLESKQKGGPKTAQKGGPLPNSSLWAAFQGLFPGMFFATDTAVHFGPLGLACAQQDLFLGCRVGRFQFAPPALNFDQRFDYF